MITEEDLQNFTKGKKDAFDKIYQMYSSGMFGICLRYVRCKDDAQDILQEAFIKIYKNCHTYNSDKPIGAWIKTIVIHTAINYLKKRNKLVLSNDDSNIEYIPEETEGLTDIQDIKERLLAVLKQLPDGYRTVFNLYVIDNLTHKEISAYLGITEGTSKSQYFKAKGMIKKMLTTEITTNG